MKSAIHKMTVDQAAAALDALAHPIRLGAVIRMLRSGNEGVPAGQLAVMGAVRQNNMSQHLAVLLRAGIVEARRDKKSVIYTANKRRLMELALLVREPVDTVEMSPEGDEHVGGLRP